MRHRRQCAQPRAGSGRRSRRWSRAPPFAGWVRKSKPAPPPATSRPWRSCVEGAQLVAHARLQPSIDTLAAAFRADWIDIDDDDGVLLHSGHHNADPNRYEVVVGIIEGIYVVTRHVGTVELVIDRDRSGYTCRWKPQP